VARAPGSGKFNPRMGAGVGRSPRGPSGIKQAPQAPTPHHLTDQRLEGWLAQAPRGFADARPGALSRHPAQLLTVKIRQPSHEFTFGVGMSFIPYPLVLTPVV
jgi:hypothetical protein